VTDRKPLISGNWKMHHNQFEALQLVQKLSYVLTKADYDAVDVSGPPAFPGLPTGLRDPRALVGLHVCRAFGNVGEAAKHALPALIEVLNQDPDPEVRKEVSLTLSKLPGR